MSIENHASTMSFDRMRSMLVRAAEIRDSEQQQVFDALDEIHARLAPLESLGSVRKRMSELPDRTEFGAIGKQIDELLIRLEAQDTAIAGLTRNVQAVTDQIASPIAELGRRLEDMFEGAGRMDGLKDRIAGLHKRVDDLHHHLDKQDARLDGLPSAVHGPLRERLEALEVGLRSRLDDTDEHIDGGRYAVQRSLGETADGLGAMLGEARKAIDADQDAVNDLLANARVELSGALDAQTTRLDPTAKLEALGERLERLGERLDEVTTRLSAVEDNVSSRIGKLVGSVDTRLSEIGNSVTDRPDAKAIVSLVRSANEESEQRHAGQLDEAMATFAELILGDSPTRQAATQSGRQTAAPTPLPSPRPSQRRSRKNTKSRNGQDDGDDTEADEH